METTHEAPGGDAPASAFPGPPGFSGWPCPLCGSSRARRLFSIPSRWDDGPRDYDILRCLVCSLRRCSPAPSEVLLSRFYATFDNEATARAHREWIDADFDRTLALLERLAPAGGRLADIGCGTGRFLSRAAARGWSAVGVDPSLRAAETARREAGVEVLVGTAAEPGLPAGSFDVVHASHVLEHVPDPVGLTRALALLLRPGGLLVLTTPNAASLLARVFGGRFPYWIPPEHLTSFTPAAMRRLTAAAGLAPVRLGSRGTEFDTFLFLRNRTPLSASACRAISRAADGILSTVAPRAGSVLEAFARAPRP